jgi:hypothetical protein
MRHGRQVIGLGQHFLVITDAGEQQGLAVQQQKSKQHVDHGRYIQRPHEVDKPGIQKMIFRLLQGTGRMQKQVEL